MGVFLSTCFVFAINFYSIHVWLACLNFGFVCFLSLILPLYNDLSFEFWDVITGLNETFSNMAMRLL